MEISELIRDGAYLAGTSLLTILTRYVYMSVKELKSLHGRIDVHDRLASRSGHWADEIDSHAIANGRAYPKHRKPLREN